MVSPTDLLDSFEAKASREYFKGWEVEGLQISIVLETDTVSLPAKSENSKGFLNQERRYKLDVSTEGALFI